jgi:hypothetical protein
LCWCQCPGVAWTAVGVGILQTTIPMRSGLPT